MASSFNFFPAAMASSSAFGPKRQDPDRDGNTALNQWTDLSSRIGSLRETKSPAPKKWHH